MYPLQPRRSNAGVGGCYVEGISTFILNFFDVKIVVTLYSDDVHRG
jgi:hypothetical protein